MTTKKAPLADSSLSKPDLVEVVREAGLRWVSDEQPGIRYLKTGKGFRYVAPDKTTVRDDATLARITYANGRGMTRHAPGEARLAPTNSGFCVRPEYGRIRPYLFS